MASVAPGLEPSSPRITSTVSSGSTHTLQSRSQALEEQAHPLQACQPLRRALNLLTTKGEPIPAIAETIAQLHSQPNAHSHSDLYLSPPHSGTATKGARSHRRAHSSTIPSASSSPLMSAPESVARRRSISVAGTRLNRVGGSIRQGVMDASSFLATRRSSEQSSLHDNPWSFPADITGSKNTRRPLPITSPSSESASSFTASRSTQRKKANTVGAIRRRLKSASDAFTSWQRPRTADANSAPGAPPDAVPIAHSASFNSSPALQPVEDVSLTGLPKTGSPDEVSPLQLQMDEEKNMEKGKWAERDVDGRQVEEGAGTSTVNALVVEPPTPVSPTSPSALLAEPRIPALILNGTPLFKVTSKKSKQYWFKLDPDQGQILWRSKKPRIIPIESIKEIRTGSDARYYREQFQLASSYEDRWLTLVYVLDSEYKTVHLIAPTRDIFVMWDTSIRKLHDIRKKLMDGLGHEGMRQAVWEKQFWRASDGEEDAKLDFREVEEMCRRLNILHSREDLLRRFSQADGRNRGYLDFPDFRKFVTSLKARPDIERIFKNLARAAGSAEETLDYAGFTSFMRDIQKCQLPEEDLRRIFVKYAQLPESEGSPTQPPASPARNPLELVMQSAGGLDSITPNNSPSDAIGQQNLPHLSPSQSSSPWPSVARPTVPFDKGVWICKTFTSFLLSPENSGFKDEKMDMTRPLPEYFVSSSHNTYLVGHQLVGESTIEGYARALLHGCRSVEYIYDGEFEPVVYHGKTLTSKVSLRDICSTIVRYAFVTSQYPIIISAEIHCCVAQQAMIANIMCEVFGDALVRTPADGPPKIDVLPSPDDLKGKVLLKAKNLYISSSEDRDTPADTESSSTETSTSDTDFKDELKHEWQKARATEAETIRGLKSEISKAKDVLKRVKPRRSSDNPAARPLLLPAAASSTSSMLSGTDLTRSPTPTSSTKVKMAHELISLLVYTVGVKCRGINKKEVYAPEHMFSLSENTANRMLKQSMMDLIKHNRTHLVRTYPKGTRIGSTNYEPHRYWSAGAQLVAINWQTFDHGYMINQAMFQRNLRAGYVLKPPALRNADKQLLARRTKHFFDVKIISAQQLPRRKDSSGREIMDKSVIDPYVEISLHIPDWTHVPFLLPGTTTTTTSSPLSSPKQIYSPPTGASTTTATSARTLSGRTSVVKNNGWNPVWEEKFSLPFDCVGGMIDLIFVRFAVRQEDDEEENLAVYCTSLASLSSGYRHLPLHDAQLSQYLFSTLFVKTSIRDADA